MDREPFATAQCHTEHCQLDGAEKDQRARAGAERQIGEGKTDHIGEQHRGAAPVGFGAGASTGPEQHEQAQRQRTGNRLDHGKSCRINKFRPEGEAAQHRIGSEGQHGDAGQQHAACDGGRCKH